MKLENGKTIADSLTPTFENVAREFITDTLEKILFSQKLPNFKFEFNKSYVFVICLKLSSNLGIG